MSRANANLLLVLVALIWGSAFVAQVHGMAGVGPMTFTGLRFLLGALVVAPFAWREWQARRLCACMAGDARKPLRAGHAWQVAGLGTLLFFGAAFQQIGIQTTTVTNAGFLTALYVPLVPLLSWMVLRHLPHWTVWPAAAGCLYGTFLLSGAADAAGPLAIAIGIGDAWIIASSLFWAAHVLFVGRVADRLNAPFLVAGGQFVVCGIAGLAWGAASEPITLAGVVLAAWPIAYAGILSVGVGFTGQVIGQRYSHAADAAIILSSETLFAAVFGALLMGDRLSASGMLGGGLIFGCILAVQLVPLVGAGMRRMATASARDRAAQDRAPYR